MTARWLEAADRLGEDPTLDVKPTVVNRGRMEIGDRFRLASRPVQSHVVTGPSGRLFIGDDVAIAFGAAIACFERIEIGDDVKMAPYVVIMDTDFHVHGQRGEHHETHPISIGKGVRIGSRVTILRGATIGEGAFVEAGSVVSGEVPRGARVSGVPARAKVAARGAAGALGDEVPLVVMRALGLGAPPALDQGPSQIAQWDSLGALKLLLALEDSFAVSLAEDEVARAVSVSDIVGLVTRALARAESSRGVAS